MHVDWMQSKLSLSIHADVTRHVLRSSVHKSVVSVFAANPFTKTASDFCHRLQRLRQPCNADACYLSC